MSDLGSVLAKNLPKVFQFVLGNGAKPAGMPLTRFLKEGDPVEVEAGLPINGQVRGEGEVELVNLPQGKVATTSHFGSYEKLPDADAAIKVWIEKNGKRQVGSPWHVYVSVSDPATTAPEKLETMVYYPIQ